MLIGLLRLCINGRVPPLPVSIHVPTPHSVRDEKPMDLWLARPLAPNDGIPLKSWLALQYVSNEHIEAL